MLFNSVIVKSQLFINLVLALIILNSIFSFNCQASQSVDRSIIFYPQQTIQIDRHQRNILADTDFKTSFQLRIGQTAIIKSESFELKFLNVVKDSRCPKELNCFESGQIEIAVEIIVKDRSYGNLQIIHNASHKNSETIKVDNYLIKFVKAEPYPQNTLRIKASDYVITLMVSYIG
ncbi:hypothetical protein [Chamaesiphon sp. OTE_20_metabat_361]|uniref:hypothetical protein n=1 Tax=Chamaesiphon sp. OTE_20_metabat_361 TaxID=2964689 RepID=UPI00286ACF46|nr:hypothetical protein [Chamaesiphon sp. OTE_20_metabat_361]